jgi:3-methylcrotonyl-CoA carboxylase alpha subunit
MSDAAVRFAQAVGYQGAGTAEFVLVERRFHFLELNARIQVEHPVTEAVTGLDLVEWQLRVAAGERIDELRSAAPHGHAVEVRLYAEDPRSFLPQTGRIDRLRLPAGIRVDAGVAEGDEIGTSYDPMLAKLIAYAGTRDEALDRLGAALAETEVGGVVTNLPFLRWLVAHPALRAGETTTAFLVEHPPLSAPPPVVAAGPWRTPFRLNLPAPAVAPPPDEATAAETAGAGGSPKVTAPMPGTVLRVLVAPGEHVEARQPLVVLEAMKMETPLLAPYASEVRRVHVQAGDRVAGGAVLLELAE